MSVDPFEIEPDPYIEAAERVIDALERGAPIGTEVLTVLSRAVGESADLLTRRRKSGFLAPTNRQRLTAILELRAFVNRRKARDGSRVT